MVARRRRSGHHGEQGIRPDAGASAAKPAPAADATQARTLEQVVGELLEPVIRHWLETNLPRMVEKVVRDEVARALAAERRAPKV